MNKKIIGILLCLLMVATMVPSVIGTQATVKTTSDEPLMGPVFEKAIIIGWINHVHKIGNIVFARAMKVYYIGYVGDHKHFGMIHPGELISFREYSRFHMTPMHSYTRAFGMVYGLKLW
jgi:hypothetical protein